MLRLLPSCSSTRGYDDTPAALLESKTLFRVSKNKTMLCSLPKRWRPFFNAATRRVERLIAQATSHENLCQCYIGWCAFW